MHENYYNRREEKIFSSDNWWDWEIGTPENLLEGLVCISEDISQKLIDKYLEPINRYVPLPSMTMSNRINTAYSSIFSGVLQKDYKKFQFLLRISENALKLWKNWMDFMMMVLLFNIIIFHI